MSEKEKTTGSSLNLELRNRINTSLSYRPEDLINMMPQLALLLENRKALAEQLGIGNETVIEAMDYVDRQICLLLGLVYP